jgi:hypothetical protein
VVSRREVLTIVAVTAAVWLLGSGFVLLVPLRLLVTLAHESGHALMATALGGHVQTVTVNRYGGGLMQSRSVHPSTTYSVLVASSGYVGAALLGAAMLELSKRLRTGRVALAVLAVAVALVALLWVPWTFSPDAASSAVTGSSRGDGRFTLLVCLVAVVVLVGLVVQPLVRLRRGVVVVLATCLCLGAVEDLRVVLDLSSRGGHSDAAAAAAVTPLSSWVWAAMWMLFGVAVCGLAVWSLVGREDRERSSRAVGVGGVGST